MRVWALILAGGASRRMRRDKLTLPRVRGGEASVIDHVLAVAAACAERVTVAAPPGGVSFPVPNGVTVVCDPAWYQGPLAALANAWPNALAADALLVLAGDLPGIDPAVPAALASRLAAAPEVDAAVVVRDGVPQPLLALYRERAGAVFRQAAAAGERRLLPVLARMAVRPVDADALGWPVWWTKPVHTPADYEAWLRQTEGSA
ncbi:molybdenum cofactor guanylyltransferase [Alicyclobacillus macrosporangiidus]|uniref:Molybdopterin-guanine dinucleotide biosynthesis protein A n=1 Tax=Alicyclobacillus macrosporangiidus TaxID=392015 RepID=A0A1I7KK31_9BACL|nr:NTP transferase domain-containing protein [Alicyclobacillus macrosporangiidus]SFU97818.1 molybdopterin-guanine dinucleotide biosynthesis protein A [Alicyclobacillus macrosporangiidus]